MWAAVEGFAERASAARLAVCLLLVVVAFTINAAANLPVEQATRAAQCDLWTCLAPLRPEARHGGYSAAEFRDFVAAIGPLRSRALLALITDLPLMAASAAALLTAAGIAVRGLPLSERPRRILIGLPLAFVVADIIEDALLAIAYAGLADVAAIVPWATALKFGLLTASVLLSALLGFTRLAWS